MKLSRLHSFSPRRAAAFHFFPLALAVALLAPGEASAQVSLTTPGVAHTQNFDSLPASGSATWTNNSTVPGWFHARTGTGTTIVANNGSSNAGNLYSYGTGTATDRALGSLGSGNAAVGNLFWGIRLQNNTGVTITSLEVSYVGEQWRNSAAAAQTVAFSYLVGSPAVTGSLLEFQSAGSAVAALNFTSPISGGAAGAIDGNSAPNRLTVTATITGLSIPIGTEAILRWSDPDHTGADHGLSIDDFSVTPNPGGGPVTPNLSLNDVAVTEGNVGTATAAFTVSLSAPAGPGGVTFDISTTNGTATTADNDYVLNSLTGQSIPAGSSTYNFNVSVNGDTTAEANEIFFVNVTNVTGVGVTVTDGQGQGTINNDDVSITLIHDVQGPGGSSPFVGASVTVRGIVTAVKSNGFFVQEEDAEVDADPATSEGVLVFTSTMPPAAAAVGNLVQVTGTVAEFVPTQDPLQPPLTEIVSPTVVQISSGNPLPAPVPLTPTFPDPVGVHDQLERVEAMRISVSSLTVSGPTLGNVNEPNATSTTTGVFYGTVTGVPRPFREAGIQAPDPPPAGSIPPIPRFDSNPERIRVDSDGLIGGGSALNVGVGTVVTSLVGPLDYSFRTYTILPESTPAVAGGPVATAVTTPLNTEFTVAAYNLERFFDTVNDGNGAPTLTTTAFNKRLEKASLGIRDYLKTPDIIGVVEVENLTTLQALATQISIDAVAATQPDPMYQAYLVEGNDVGGIDVGFLVKTAPVVGATPRVTVSSVSQELDGTLLVNPDTSTATLNDRPPLLLDAAVNHANGATFPLVVIVNHLRSLIGVSDTSPGSNGWATVGDRNRHKRQKQAEDLANLVQARQIANPVERIVLVGDFNAFDFNDGFGDSMRVIAGTPTPDNETVVPGDGIDLVNPDFVNLAATAPPLDRYSFVFDGNAQSLDHALINAPMVTDTLARREEHPRINADFPETDRNLAAPGVTRLADHDPIVTYYKVASFASSNADLANLTVNAGTLAPVFAPGTTSYATTVSNPVNSLTATPTAADAGATIEVQINGGGFATVASGTPSGPLSLNVGTNTADVKVTASDTTTMKTYSIAIHRCAAISLSGLPNGIVGATYTGAAAASGGSGTYTYALTGALPTGLALNPGTGALTTTPSATGTFSFQITATDTAPPGTCTGVANYTVHIGSAVAAGDLVIREFRVRGNSGTPSVDEYVVIHNRTAAPVTIAAPDGSPGFAVAKESGGGTLVFTIPNGTVIPAKGHYLGANDTNGGTVVGVAHDAPWSTDIGDGLGLGLFKSATTFTAPQALDAVGFNTPSAAPFVEGTGLPSLAAVNGEYAWVRKAPNGVVQDTNNNLGTGANLGDFTLVAINGAAYNGVQSVLGAPSPTGINTWDTYTGLTISMVEPNVGPNYNPNRIRKTDAPGGGDRLEFRRRIKNNTGAPITSLRLRFTELTTFNSPGYTPGITQADLRPNTSITVAPNIVTSLGPLAPVGLTLVTPPAQAMGGGLNSIITIPGGLANGASIDVNIALRVSRVGAYRFFATVEAQ